MNVLALFKNIRLFVLDIDGVLTDGSLLLLDDGQMARRMNVKDGYALQLAVKRGYKILAISGGTSQAVKLRLEKLGIYDVFISIADKPAVMRQFMDKQALKAEQVLYMGDDIPDLEAMRLSGLAACPADAVAEIRAASMYISPFKGGEGCVRDVIEKVLKLNGHWTHDEHARSM